MNTINNPQRKDWRALTMRPAKPAEQLEDLVSEVFSEIRKWGDVAVKKYTERFDKIKLDSFLVAGNQLKSAENELSDELKSAIGSAINNIEKFHASQAEENQIIETTAGVRCWRESRPIESVGIYIPGGSAPLFSTVLMLGIPAKLAGCKEVVLCTPPDKNGIVHPAILYAANQVGVDKVYCVGGIQAIAAMTFGTETIPKVDKIFGPGNQYVTAAKQRSQLQGVAIDMPAGPSELLVIADDSCNPAYVAADLLSQAEHGVDSQVVLLSTSQSVVDQVMVELEIQLSRLPRKEMAEKALLNSKAIVLNSIFECIEFSNLYAPEHLIIALKNYMELLPDIVNAGSVFLGNFSCESAGDYASGTNHTLPTQGYSRMYSGVSLDSFIKKITFQEVSEKGIVSIGKTIEIMAETEGLTAHKNAVSIRLDTIVK